MQLPANVHTSTIEMILRRFIVISGFISRIKRIFHSFHSVTAAKEDKCQSEGTESRA